MGLIGGQLGYRLLRAIAPRQATDHQPAPQAGQDPHSTPLRVAFGPDIFEHTRGKVVLDFGCGWGHDVLELAREGATRVIGLDLQERGLARGRQVAEREGLADRCHFTTWTDQKADVILSKDAFEHFDDPSAILTTMSKLLKPDGVVLASFGPTWLHPLGGHLFSVFPWSHLLFTEEAQIRWRSDFKSDGATRFREVAGGLNQLTIAHFERLVAGSPLALDRLETVPIRGLKLLKSRPLREFGSSLVRCQLRPRAPTDRLVPAPDGAVPVPGDQALR